MEKQIKPINPVFDFSGVPSWYVLCNNNLCPLQSDCLRFQAAAQAPENLEVASCVMPKVQNGRVCRCVVLPRRSETQRQANKEGIVYKQRKKKSYTLVIYLRSIAPGRCFFVDRSRGTALPCARVKKRGRHEPFW